MYKRLVGRTMCLHECLKCGEIITCDNNMIYIDRGSFILTEYLMRGNEIVIPQKVWSEQSITFTTLNVLAGQIILSSDSSAIILAYDKNVCRFLHLSKNLTKNIFKLSRSALANRMTKYSMSTQQVDEFSCENTHTIIHNDNLIAIAGHNTLSPDMTNKNGDLQELFNIMRMAKIGYNELIDYTIMAGL